MDGRVLVVTRPAARRRRSMYFEMCKIRRPLNERRQPFKWLSIVGGEGCCYSYDSAQGVFQKRGFAKSGSKESKQAPRGDNALPSPDFNECVILNAPDDSSG